MHFCINLGGIANVSFEINNERLAFDICACNMVLNHYAGKEGFSYDENGKIAARGNSKPDLLIALEKLPYYFRNLPKSLAREEIEKDLFPLIDSYSLSPQDVLATFCTHIAGKISEITNKGSKSDKVLLTGGGAFNTFLVNKLIENSHAKIVIPEKKIIEYKEAIIFAFLGVLKMRGEINCLKSVTGAKSDSSSGAVFQPLVK
jgi:anhydro-N-acetylmuramic acid kinase